MTTKIAITPKLVREDLAHKHLKPLLAAYSQFANAFKFPRAFSLLLLANLFFVIVGSIPLHDGLSDLLEMRYSENAWIYIPALLAWLFLHFAVTFQICLLALLAALSLFPKSRIDIPGSDALATKLIKKSDAQPVNSQSNGAIEKGDHNHV
ncbi:hypothetical protein ICN48_10590 [Polynucleobacter sp. JS-Safj-400b-B2]|uniref:hypothetical protein n=1 Tax=Polynucleobacter sp. JS-Safj-400b-B2 TaxID=2576921 RepID=UPI001C0C874B|nr:hypothetical protein [Polynucleobacter sp. JS-Safj-400b-B2]MBU3626677.1 hypothetical protein [Polynucleobacter sp. JS-Safj-400b-B2]